MLVGRELKTLFNSPSTISLFILEQDWVKAGFQIEVLALIQNLMENKHRHASGPVHQHRVSYIFEHMSKLHY